MPEKKLVSILIVNWNGLDYLKNCLLTIAKIDYSNYEIVIFDNGSTDGSVEFAREYYPHAKLIENNSNIGFVGGNNEGYKYCRGEYILFLNNDTLVEKDFLDALVAKIESSDKIGGVQPKLLKFDQETIDGAGSYLTNYGFLYHYGYREKDGQKFKQGKKIFSVKGAAMMFKREVLEKVGLFDPDYFAYFEETDLCWRVWLAGYEIFYVPASVVYHKAGGTTENDMDFVNSLICFHSFKNRISSLIKNLSWFNFIIIFPVHIFICIFVSFDLLYKGMSRNFFAVWRAMGWNILNIGKTLRKRKIVQKEIRKISDAKLFPIIKKNPGLSYFLNTIKLLIARK